MFASDRESPRVKAWLPDDGVQHAFPFTCQKRAVREQIPVFVMVIYKVYPTTTKSRVRGHNLRVEILCDEGRLGGMSFAFI